MVMIRDQITKRGDRRTAVIKSTCSKRLMHRDNSGISDLGPRIDGCECRLGRLLSEPEVYVVLAKLQAQSNAVPTFDPSKRVRQSV